MDLGRIGGWATKPAWADTVDRAAAAVHVRVPSTRHTDRLLRGLSERANGGLLWIGVAGVMAVAGGPHERRAAVRGLASMAVAATLTNVVGKVVFGGPRPLVDDVPLRRRLHRMPTSGSFPSGHSANAAAFLVGVALESPPAAFGVAPLAAGVAYSRLHTGAHWLSDVLGGLGIGTGVALGGAPLWQRVDPPAGKPVDLPTSDDGSGLLLVVNPRAGQGAVRAEKPSDVFLRAYPAAATLRLDDDVTRDDIRNAAQENGIRALGVSGGDGSVGTVMSVAAEVGLPLLVIPGGTLNHFARTAGVGHADDAVLAWREGRGVLVDAATLTSGDGSGSGRDTHTVLNTFSVGVYPDLVEEREKREHLIGKWPAAVVAAVHLVRNARPIEVRTANEHRRIWSLFAGVNRYQPPTLLPLRRDRLDDGVLDIRVVDASNRLPRLSLFVNVVVGNQLGGLLTGIPLVRRALGLELGEERVLRLDRGTASIAWDGEAADGEGEVVLRMGLRVPVYAPTPQGRRHPR